MTEVRLQMVDAILSKRGVNAVGKLPLDRRTEVS